MTTEFEKSVLSILENDAELSKLTSNAITLMSGMIVDLEKRLTAIEALLPELLLK